MILPFASDPVLHAAAAGTTAFAVTFFCTPLVRLAAVRYGWVAKPLEDRWGRRIIARLGGLALYAGIMGASALWVKMDPPLGWLAVGLSLVFALGLLDDVRRMPPYTKLVAQLVIGCGMAWAGIRLPLSQWTWLSIPLSVLWFVLIMNAFNLLDNMDGLAASIGAIAAGYCAFHAARAGRWELVGFAAAICGSSLAFLRFNAPPAKIYMGDSGSHLLGLGLAALSMLGTWRHSTQLLSVLAVPSLVLAVPIFDTCFVTIQRLRHRQHPFVGGTDHVSHRLAILGLSTRQTVAVLAGVSLGLGWLSLASMRLQSLEALAIWLIVVTSLVLIGRYLAGVNVYRVARADGEPEGHPPASRTSATMIDTMLLHKRRIIEILADFSLLSSAYVVAYLLRFDGILSGDLEALVMRSLPILLVIKLSCLAGFGLYRGVWRYVSVPDLLAIAKAMSLASVLSSAAFVYLWRFEGYSRSVMIIDWLLSFFAVGGSRVVERFLDDGLRAMTSQRVPTVVIGAGDTAELVLRALRYERTPMRRVVALLDDDVRTHGSRIHGCPVIGGRERLAELITRERVRDVIVAIPDPPGELLDMVRGSCEPAGVTWRVVTAGMATVS